jgi:hypothetical protein
VEEKIRINRSAHILLDFDENLPAETVSAATVIIIVITAAFMQKNVRIDKVVLEGLDAERMKVTFHNEQDNTDREYIFETAMLLKAVQKASHSFSGHSLQNELVKEFEHAYQQSADRIK